VGSGSDELKWMEEPQHLLIRALQNTTAEGCIDAIFAAYDAAEIRQIADALNSYLKHLKGEG
jgi:hypothetical protein